MSELRWQVFASSTGGRSGQERQEIETKKKAGKEADQEGKESSEETGEEVRKEEKKEKKELNAVLEDAESENKDLEDTEVSEDKPPSSPFST